MIKVRVLDTTFRESNLDSLPRKKFTWVDSVHPSSLELKKLSSALAISEHDLKEALDEDERPRTSSVGGYSVIIFKAPFKVRKHIAEVSFAIFFNKNIVLTLRTRDLEAFEQLLETHHKIQPNPSHFIFRLLDEVANSYFRIFDIIDEQIDLLEREIFENANQGLVKRMFDMRKTLIYSHKALTSNREVITSIEKEYVTNIQKNQFKNYRSLYNDITQLVDLGATYRDILTGTLDTYLSSVSFTLNITIKRLTAYGSLILVPTLISGIYGMNFRVMPEIYWKYGYVFALSLMVLSVGLLYVYFKVKDWI